MIEKNIKKLIKPLLMNKNRQAERDKKRNEDDYLINLKSELKIKELINKINVLMTEPIKILIEAQKTIRSN